MVEKSITEGHHQTARSRITPVLISFAFFFFWLIDLIVSTLLLDICENEVDSASGGNKNLGPSFFHHSFAVPLRLLPSPSEKISPSLRALWCSLAVGFQWLSALFQKGNIGSRIVFAPSILSSPPTHSTHISPW